MKSTNFEFLRPTWEELADLGAMAEQYTHPDPQSAAAKLRTFAEQIVLFVYHKHGLPKPYQCNLNDLLKAAAFAQAVPRVICSKLHSLRIHGNKGAHGESVLPQTVVWLLQEAYELGRWMHLGYANGSKADCPAFTPPSATNGTEAERRLKQEKVSILQRLAAQEAEMQRVLAELEAARSKAQVAEATATELQAAQAQGQQVADALAFDEETTRRRLIDSLLVSAGWKVGANGTSTEQVGQEVEVLHQPTPSGKGKGDYVLWGDNGKPLGVVEGKKTAVDAEAGRTQAKCYADGLEQMFGQRPAIFYTNGHDIWLWNDAAGEPPRKLFGFYSQDSLEYLHYQRANREALTKTAPNPAIAGRMYQIEAIKRVAERFAAKHRQALVVQATGTGKTRVAVSLCDLLLRAKWAKRILFLCDRKELRKQAHNVFKEHLPGEPRTYVTSATSKDRDKRIYLATYPAMMECFESFDPGFFDLIIADESHRSIYNRYRELFAYFDALQVGLTATPVEFIARNTYTIFGCEDRDPTAYFSFEDAINHTPPYLVPFEVVSHTTPFLRKGIKYSEMNEDQRRQLEEDEAVPAAVEFEQAEVDKAVFNKDTNRLILLCPAWKKYGSARAVKPDTVILHSRADDVVPFADSEELARSSGATLIEVGTDHRLADPEPLAPMLKACNDATLTLKTGDGVRAVVRKTAVFGLFCEYRTHEILVLIPEISWIPSFASCEQVAAVGDELEVKIIHIDRERNKSAGSIKALHPESDPWHGAWRLGVGDVMEAAVVRWVENADRCGSAGGYLLALRPAALVMLCGQEAGRFKSGEKVSVTVTSIDPRQAKVTVALVP